MRYLPVKTMFGLFKKSLPPLENYAVLGADLHSHLLPGIDDGAPDMASSLLLLREMYDLGFQHVYTTPHVREEIFPNKPDQILQKRDALREAALQQGIPVFLDAAAEYFVDEYFVKALRHEELLCLPGRRVLIEMSPQKPFANLHQVIFDLQMKGYRPILAHPERYPYFRHRDDYLQIKNMGCALQVNLPAISGYYGKKIQLVAGMLLQRGMADYLATDLHHERHAAHLRQALAQPDMQKALREHTFLNAELVCHKQGTPDGV
jgi:tyrosine-protein phosphatase YwqE